MISDNHSKNLFNTKTSWTQTNLVRNSKLVAQARVFQIASIMQKIQVHNIRKFSSN